MTVDRTTDPSRSYGTRCVLGLLLAPLLMGAGDPYAAAGAALEAGQPEKALSVLKGSNGPIDDYRHLLEAKAHQALGAADQAVAAARKVRPPPGRSAG